MRTLRAFLPIAGLLVLWELLGRNPEVAFFFSTPTAVALALWRHTVDGVLPRDLLVTAAPTILGFACSVLVGTCVGLLLAVDHKKSGVFRAYVNVMANLPIFAIAPMMIVWFGVGLNMKFALALFSSMFVAISQAYDGALSVTPRQREIFANLGAGPWQTVRYLLLPSALTWIINGMRMTATLSLLGVFVGEFMASERGLGHRMLKAGSLYDVGYVLACAIYMVALVLALNWAASLAGRRKLVIVERLTVHRQLWSRRSTHRRTSG